MEHWLEIDKKAVLFVYFLVYFVNGKFLRIELFGKLDFSFSYCLPNLKEFV